MEILLIPHKSWEQYLKSMEILLIPHKCPIHIGKTSERLGQTTRIRWEPRTFCSGWSLGKSSDLPKVTCDPPKNGGLSITAVLTCWKTISHRIHVWYIYIYLPTTNGLVCIFQHHGSVMAIGKVGTFLGTEDLTDYQPSLGRHGNNSHVIPRKRRYPLVQYHQSSVQASSHSCPIGCLPMFVSQNPWVWVKTST